MSSSEKTVRVRVAVVVDGKGMWFANGGPGWSDADLLRQARKCINSSPSREFILMATLPLPAAETVEAEVVGEVRDGE